MAGGEGAVGSVGSCLVDRILQQVGSSPVDGFSQSHQTELIDPVVLLFTHQVADKYPTQHTPFQVVVHMDLLHRILAGEEVEVVHAVDGRTHGTHRDQRGGQDERFGVELVLHNRHTRLDTIGSRLGCLCKKTSTPAKQQEQKSKHENRLYHCQLLAACLMISFSGSNP